VPFVRVSRDKRGYENIYLFEVSSRRPSKPRILYWFRTPPGVRVGREPFDEPVRRALEAQNPGVTFDWKKLTSDTLVPPADVENWRERRRAEREAKRARKGDEEEAAGGSAAGRSADELADGSQASEAPAGPTPSLKPVAAQLPADARPFAGHRHRRRGGRVRHSTYIPDVSVTLQGDSPPAQQAGTNSSAEAAESPSGASPAMSSILDTTRLTADSAEMRVTADSSEAPATARLSEKRVTGDPSENE
jgi:hypothetical protein